MQAADLADLRSLSEAACKRTTTGAAGFKIKAWRILDGYATFDA